MAIGRRRKGRQQELFVAASEIRALGTPPGLQGLATAQAALSGHVSTAVVHILRHFRRHIGLSNPIAGPSSCTPPWHRFTTTCMLVPSRHSALWKPVSSTGC